MFAPEIKVDGIGEIAVALSELGRKVGGKVARDGVRAAGVVIRDDAKRRAPVNSRPSMNFRQFPGTLRKAIAYGVDRRRSGDGRAAGRVFVRAGKKQRYDAFYWFFVEFGTKGHKVRIKNKKVLSDLGTFFGTEVNIPAIPAHPFLRPAAEAMARAAVYAMEAKLREGIRDAARRK